VIANPSTRGASHTILTCTFLALIAWLPIPLGSKHPWAVSFFEAAIFLLTIAVLIHYFRSTRPLPAAFTTARPLIILLALNLIWLIIQCMPMPEGLMLMLSPKAMALEQAAPLPPSFLSLSLDVHSSWLQVLKATSLLLFFCLSLYLIDSLKHLKWLVYIILFSALIQVIYGAFMMLTGIEYAFFISKAELHSHIGSATGTFTNRDHLAGYLEMALALGIGYMLSMLSGHSSSSSNWKQQLRQWSELLLGPKARLRLMLVLLCLGLVLTHSRGGNSAFFISLGVSGALFLLLARKKQRATVIFLTSLIVLDIIMIGSWVGLSKVVNRLEKTTVQTENRDNAYAAALPMIDDFILTGSGSGTLFGVFPAYKTADLPGYWNHLHNDYLEFLSEQGLPGFITLAGCVGYALLTVIRTLRRRKSSFALGMSFASLMGITAILIHSAVDFNLQILANITTFILLLSVAMISASLATSRRRMTNQRPSYSHSNSG